MNRLKTLIFLSFRIFSFGRKGEKLTRPLLGSILAIAVSLIPLIVVIQISDGMIGGITERIIETDSSHLQTFPYSPISVQELIDKSKEIEQLEFVRNCTVERQGFGLVYSKEGKGGAQIRAVEPDFYSSDKGVQQYIQMEDGVFDLSRPDSVMIGRSIARNLGLSTGDEIKVLTVKRFSNGKFLPKISKYKIQGIFSTGYDELDKMWLFIPLSTGEKILTEDMSKTYIGIKTLDPYNNLKEDMLSVRNLLPSRWAMYTWKNQNRSQLEIYQTTKSLLIFIMALIVFVAIVNISSSMVMLVIEKREEISILKCIGASPSDISVSYILTGFFTGIMGSLVGLSAGIIMSVFINEIIRGAEKIVNLVFSFFSFILSPIISTGRENIQLLNSEYYLETIPVTINPSDIFIVFIVTVLLATVSSSVPALKAGKIKPLEILRKH